MRLFLGHKNLNTTVRAYCGLEQADALRRLDALIDRHRKNPETASCARLPIADWPARDRALWEKGVEPKGLFESGGAGADWSDAVPPQDRSRLQPLAVLACGTAPVAIPT